MPCQNHWEEKGVYRKFHGLVSGEELLCAVEETERDERFDSLQYVLNDFLDIDSITISAEDIKIVATIDKAASLSNPNIRIAIAANEMAIQSMAVLYRDCSPTPYETRLYTNLKDARTWLRTFES